MKKCSVAKGVSTRKEDPAICMVIGCERKAIYRNAATNTDRKSKGATTLQRGYCFAHKSHAFTTDLYLPRVREDR